MPSALIYEAVVLAGGRGRRMGGADKGLLLWQGLPLIDHVLQRIEQQSLAPQRLRVSVNRHFSEYAQRAEIVVDEVGGFKGPLHGIQAALRDCQAPWLLVVPCDSPLLPVRLAQELFERGQGMAAWVQSPTDAYPLCCLLPRTCLPQLDDFLEQGQRRVRDFLLQINAVAVDFAQSEAFVNFNAPDALLD